MLSDDLWSYQRMRSHADISECTSFRCLIDGIVHRIVKSTRQEILWCSICLQHWDVLPPACDRPVDCLECLADGG